MVGSGRPKGRPPGPADTNKGTCPTPLRAHDLAFGLAKMTVPRLKLGDKGWQIWTWIWDLPNP